MALATALLISMSRESDCAIAPASAVIVVAQPDEKIERSARNIPKIKVLRVEGLNVYDLMRYEHLILTDGALKLLQERLAA